MDLSLRSSTRKIHLKGDNFIGVLQRVGNFRNFQSSRKEYNFPPAINDVF